MRTIFVEIEEHDALPDGCQMKFSALGPERVLETARVDGVACAVVGLDADDREVPARAALVDDSSAGQSVLVWGGAHGLRLRHPDGRVVAEAYLLLPPDEAED